MVTTVAQQHSSTVQVFVVQKACTADHVNLRDLGHLSHHSTTSYLARVTAAPCTACFLYQLLAAAPLSVRTTLLTAATGAHKVK